MVKNFNQKKELLVIHDSKAAIFTHVSFVMYEKVRVFAFQTWLSLDDIIDKIADFI